MGPGCSGHSEPVPARRRELPPQLAARPFTLDAARAAGFGRPRVAGVSRLAPRVYSLLEPTLADRVAAHLATLPGDVLVEGVTALALHGVDVGDPEPLRFCSPTGLRVRRDGVRVRRLSVTVPPSKGRILTPPAAWATASGDLDLVELVAAGDWLVRLKKATPAALQEHAATLTGRHSRTVRRAAGLVRERIDSPPESRLRLCLVLAGLPEPVCNLDIGDDVFFIAKPDLAYLIHRLLLEYEGDHHRTDRAQWEKDIKRERQLRKTGYELVRITAETLRRPRALVRDVHALLVQAGYEGPDPEFTPEWRACFEPHASSGSSGRLRGQVKVPAGSTRRQVS